MSNERPAPSRTATALIDGALLGLFMVSACTFGTVLWHPASPARAWLGAGVGARVPMGILMGLTLVALARSPWGRRSGAHMNPAVTLTFLGLGRMAPRDAARYVAAQFAGGALGVLVSWLALGDRLAHADVRFVVTQPGPWGAGGAFVAELLMAGAMMTLVLEATASPRWAARTPWLAGAVLALFIAVEAPLSGTSLNAARTVASALGARDATAVWVYLAAPLTGMTLAALAHVRRHGRADLACGKLVHGEPCLFCAYMAERPAGGPAGAPVPSASLD